MSTRHPLYRVRYIPGIREWAVTPTEHAPRLFTTGAVCTTWKAAIVYANRKAAEAATHMPRRCPQAGWITTPGDEWNLRDRGRRLDAVSDGIADITFDAKPGLVRLETALPWADNDQNRKN